MFKKTSKDEKKHVFLNEKWSDIRFKRCQEYRKRMFKTVTGYLGEISAITGQQRLLANTARQEL